MTEILISFYAYGVAGTGALSMEFAIDPNNPQQIAHTKRDTVWIASGNSNLDAMPKIYDGTFGYVVQQEGKSVAIASAIYAPNLNDSRGGSPADVKIVIPPEHAVENVPALVSLLKSMTEDFERFILDERGVVPRVGDRMHAFEQCRAAYTEIIKKNTDLIRQISLHQVQPEHRLAKTQVPPSHYPHVWELDLAVPAPGQSMTLYREDMARAAVIMIEHFHRGNYYPAPLVLISPNITNYLKVSKIGKMPVPPALATPVVASPDSASALSASDSVAANFEGAAAQVGGPVAEHKSQALLHIKRLAEIADNEGPDRDKAREALRLISEATKIAP